MDSNTGRSTSWQADTQRHRSLAQPCAWFWVWGSRCPARRRRRNRAGAGSGHQHRPAARVLRPRHRLLGPGSRQLRPGGDAKLPLQLPVRQVLGHRPPEAGNPARAAGEKRPGDPWAVGRGYGAHPRGGADQDQSRIAVAGAACGREQGACARAAARAEARGLPGCRGRWRLGRQEPHRAQELRAPCQSQHRRRGAECGRCSTPPRQSAAGCARSCATTTRRSSATAACP